VSAGLTQESEATGVGLGQAAVSAGPNHPARLSQVKIYGAGSSRTLQALVHRPEEPPLPRTRKDKEKQLSPASIRIPLWSFGAKLRPPYLKSQPGHLAWGHRLHSPGAGASTNYLPRDPGTNRTTRVAEKAGL
jgi:hypothetical protein